MTALSISIDMRTPLPLYLFFIGIERSELIECMFTTIIHYDSGPSLGREGARGELDYFISSYAKQTVLQQGLYASLAKPRSAFRQMPRVMSVEGDYRRGNS